MSKLAKVLRSGKSHSRPDRSPHILTMAPPSSRILPSPNPPSAEPGAFLFETERLLIRRYLPSDAPLLAAAANHPSVAANLRDGFPSPYTLANAKWWLSNQSNISETRYPTETALFVKPHSADNPSGELLYIGALGVTPKEDVYYRTWELGYWLTPAAWGRGYATEAVGAAIQWMFETWPTLYRIEASVYSRNEGSVKVLKKAGFLEEGTKKGAAEKDGKIQDEVMFGLRRQDLEATRQ